MSRAAISGLSNFSSRRCAREHSARCSARTNRFRLTCAARDAGSNAPPLLGEPRAEGVDPVAQLVVADRLPTEDVDHDEHEAVLLVVDEHRPLRTGEQVLQRVEHAPVVGLVGQRVAHQELQAGRRRGRWR